MSTKCVRVSSTETADEVARTLVEKFRPDMKMLSNPNYSLYEVHPSGGKPRNLSDQTNEVVTIACDGCKFHVLFLVFMRFGYKL